ncbi:MAG: ribokinase [Pseudomonadales bacterium]
MKIYSYGSINIDHIYQVPHLVQPGETLASTAYSQVLGGKGANQSIALAKAGADVSHIGRVNRGDAWAVEALREAGVDCSLVETVSAPSGHAIIQVDAAAENSIVLFAGANHSFTAADIETQLGSASAGDWLLLQNECSYTAEAVEIAVAKGMKVAFNPSPMLQDTSAFALSKISLLVVNQVEIAQLLGEEDLSETQIVEAVRAKLPGQDVVVTLGADGAMWIDDTSLTRVPAYKVEVVDTTAAGDTFLGYLLAAITRADSREQALAAGCKASSLAVQQLGASSSIPLAAQVAQL